MKFEECILFLRQESGLTQKNVADAIRVTPRQYQRFEQGEQKPGFDNLRKLADYFQVSVDWLMGRTDKREVNR